MDAFVELLIVFALVVLVPLVPALLIYCFAPERQIVEGPFKGLTLKLGGAFAMYFLVTMFVAAPFVFYYYKPPMNDLASLYVVRGTLNLEGITHRGDFDPRLLVLTLEPRADSASAAPDGTVTWSMNVRAPTDENGKIVWPFERVILEYAGHEHADLNLAAADKYGQREFRFPAVTLAKWREQQVAGLSHAN
ncbi:hypothetical protein DLJ53_00835 [Acuticoccus sediminis]|uniref:Uncharacterized protein n=1 Tax=Acuticoccus sediminis TaxID=2184697 RepID=A0A8B2NSC0_9HYPH|nr:hypothetical protein [Acuticoccus sediminis]RAI03108.1 hypothetical protein DLJ53_00835 [Acuticoccus sediminis]